MTSPLSSICRVYDGTENYTILVDSHPQCSLYRRLRSYITARPVNYRQSTYWTINWRQPLILATNWYLSQVGFFFQKSAAKKQKAYMPISVFKWVLLPFVCRLGYLQHRTCPSRAEQSCIQVFYIIKKKSLEISFKCNRFTLNTLTWYHTSGSEHLSVSHWVFDESFNIVYIHNEYIPFVHYSEISRVKATFWDPVGLAIDKLWRYM